ncbi:F-box/kelch-repeat protein At3g23880-like [Lycium barbarum]|uniref:F-box/kelch-repeat protein At3g23880-like n=1 Tax=Lycium barbarum TaxID=112863 RepID=UPI00293EA5BB|nr:F-box/kelch-repeat protein At3g23880-like [Lycium barbarum]
MSFIPDDTLFCILIKLPVKSLLRFQSVSKPWNTIISDHKFKKAHGDQSNTLGRLKFLLQKQVGTYIKDFYGVKEIESVELRNPRVVIEKILLPVTSSRILCSYDGLVLLHTYKACDTFGLWNPSTRQYKTLVCPYLDSSSKLPNACGLCYDSTTDDYKIILIFRSFYVVYSANKNLWKMRKTLPILEQSLENHSSDLFSDVTTEGISSTTEGCVYWSLDEGRKKFLQQVRKTSIIIRFDVKSDELEELSALDCVGEEELFCMSPLKGCLSLYGGETSGHESDVWIMEQDEWKCLVKVRGFVQSLKETKLLCCTEDGELIFLGLMQHHISIYNPR